MCLRINIHVNNDIDSNNGIFLLIKIDVLFLSYPINTSQGGGFQLSLFLLLFSFLPVSILRCYFLSRCLDARIITIKTDKKIEKRKPKRKTQKKSKRMRNE